MSKDFGHDIVKSFKENGLKVHNSFAVRGYYYRQGVRTLPGVLRYSKIPVSVLVEVGNLANPQDRAALLQAEHRQKIARTLLHSIKRYGDKQRRS